MFFLIFYRMCAAAADPNINNNNNETFIDRVRNLIKCPICWDVPKPGPNNEVGLCNNGHFVCYTCTIKSLQIKNECPFCRNDKFGITTTNYLANGLMSLVAQETVYACKHAMCHENTNGFFIVEHEKNCAWKPIKCPRSVCPLSLPIATLTNVEQHTCFRLQKPTLANTWDIKVNLNQFFDLDNYVCSISPAYQPRLLLPLEPFDLSPRMYLGIKEFITGSVIFYVGYLNPKGDTPVPIRTQNMLMSVHVFVGAGKIDMVGECQMVFENQTTASMTDGVVVYQDLITRWFEWLTEKPCFMCSDVTPHCHVQIVI